MNQQSQIFLLQLLHLFYLKQFLAGHFDLQTLQETIGRAVVVGLVLGFGVGIPWMYLSTKFGNAQHAYMLTLAILFVLFFLANSFGESGALTALVFGLMIGKQNTSV